MLLVVHCTHSHGVYFITLSDIAHIRYAYTLLTVKPLLLICIVYISGTPQVKSASNQ